MRTVLAFLVAFLIAGSFDARAQMDGVLHIGITGSSFRGGNLDGASPIFRFAGGAAMRYNYPSGFEFETGIDYVVKGAELEGSIEGVPITGISEITYISFPVLFGYRFNKAGSIRPRIVIGPSMSFKTDSRITFRAQGSDFEQSEIDESVEGRDLGLVFGLDANVPFKGEMLTFGLRSTFGNSNARSADPELLNTTIGFYTGIVF